VRLERGLWRSSPGPYHREQFEGLIEYWVTTVEAAQTLGIALVAGFVLVVVAGTWQAIRVWRTARALREADSDGDDLDG
jgi:hypothetical protein